MAGAIRANMYSYRQQAGRQTDMPIYRQSYMQAVMQADKKTGR